MSLMVEKLAYVKKLRHLTSEDISRLSGVPLGTLNKILSGQTKNCLLYTSDAADEL